MNREKQIAKIGNELSNAIHEHDIAWTNYLQDSQNHPKPMGEFRAMAEHLYEKGYRKQSEVASEIFDEISKLCTLHDDSWNPSRIVAHIYFDWLLELKDKYTKGGEG
jgi:hypothetical protein